MHATTPAQTPPRSPALVEPTAAEYAAFGRYAAALLGANAEWSDPGAYLEELAAVAEREGVQGIGYAPQSVDEFRLWRGVAAELGVEHDGDEDEDEDEDDGHECERCDDDLPAMSGPLCEACAADDAAKGA